MCIGARLIQSWNAVEELPRYTRRYVTKNDTTDADTIFQLFILYLRTLVGLQQDFDRQLGTKRSIEENAKWENRTALFHLPYIHTYIHTFIHTYILYCDAIVTTYAYTNSYILRCVFFLMCRSTRKRMEQATSLISGLAGERTRWNNDREEFANIKSQLVIIQAEYLSKT